MTRTQIADLAANLETGLAEVDDPVTRAEVAQRWGEDLIAIVTRLADLRARAIAEMHIDGWAYARIASECGMSRARAAQLATRGMDVVPPKPPSVRPGTDRA